MCVVGDELYVCDMRNHRLQVFSLTGEHRRSITGEWSMPQYLCCAKDRLYLVEQGGRGFAEDQVANHRGHRILHLSLQGDILQVVRHPTKPAAKFKSVCCFDHKLLASYRVPPSAGSLFAFALTFAPLRFDGGILALQGV